MTPLFKYYIFKETTLTPYSFWPSIKKKVAGFPGVLSTENRYLVGKIYMPQAERLKDTVQVCPYDRKALKLPKIF